ncbi:lantibiotic dehydratase [Streptomyces sp. W1SF4]|uniref:lantibiotic dehydratase n=1 Tax=Streptomyces sp. W1SF4 TaxID=2305220 RepID=UPI000F701F68|nr:lantibiotic dehydratase [Streptomyces sp. W1SF4]AZM93852.1 lantibiotic dehydratase [Streptomyces sp. W1SF4]
MASQPDFSATGPMLLRLAALERGALCVPLPRPDAAGSFADEDLTSYVRALAAHPVFRETVEVSSGSLAALLRKVESGARVERKHLLKACLSMSRYALRVTGRPTPFGLSAGVTALHSADRARAVIDGPGDKHVRLDAGWFAAQARTWLEEPRLRHAADVLVNDLCFLRGDRLVLGCGRDDYRGREVTVRATAFVRWVLNEAAARPVTWAALLDRAVAAHPAVDRERLDAVLLQLARTEFLLTTLAPESLDEKALARVLDLLGEDSAEGRRLTTVLGALEEFRKAPPGGGAGLWHAVHLAAGVTGPDACVAQVDLAMAADVAVPPSVTEEVERYASALWNMTPQTEVYAHMREYREAFMDKYGEAGAVPLPELIDPHTGLGFPRGYGNPPVSRDARLAAYEGNKEDTRDGRRLEVLGRLIQRGMLSPDREINLSPADVEALTAGHATPPPPALELTFQLLADHTDDLDRGDFTLVAAPMIGSATAGASMGRFAAIAGIEQPLGTLLRAPAPEGITAQLVFKPMNSRAGNVTQAGRLVPYEIVVGGMPDAGSPASLDWRDLLVAADGERLWLVHAPSGQEVHPVVPHMLNLETHAPNLVRLLAEMKHSGAARILQIWDWSGFGAAPWLPRVRLGKAVISPLRWRPSLAMRDGAHSPEAFLTALEEWREELGVPDRVCVSQADNSYEIDLREPFHRELLRRDVTKAQVRITETMRALGSCGWAGGRANEITVPLVARLRPGATRTAPPPSPVPAVHHSPGGEWFYAELSAVPETHDELICSLDEMLRPLHGQLDSWHFVRFLHPEPQVRLRVRSSDPDIAAGLQAQLEQLRVRGLIRGFRVCPYEPETARYGGPDVMADAESVFCLDSQTAAAELRLLRSGRGLSREQLTVANYGLMLDALMPQEWPEWIGTLFPKSTDGSLTRRLVSDTARLVVPGASALNLEQALATPGLAETWRTAPALEAVATKLDAVARRTGSQAARRRAVLSFLHMQHNRLVGIDRAAELRTLTLLAHIARAHTDRLKHHGGQR